VAIWIGVDVGGRRKGFDVGVIDERRLLELQHGLGRDAVVALVDQSRPELVAIDSPRSCAPAGARARDGERALSRKVCGIRWTPDETEVRSNPYYAWVVEGLELYRTLARLGTDTIEVFPTASWTRWLGRRAGRSRADWTRDGLTLLPLDGLPGRTNQDARDAIAAALTALAHTQGQTERFGELVVPANSSTLTKSLP
jgi:predicted nuclease with RNAse H fold